MGGGSIYVPVFYLLFKFSIKEAIGTSLLIIVFSSLSAFLVHMKGNHINFKTAGFLICSGIIGAQVGSLITATLPDIAVKIFFSCLTIFLSFHMWREKKDSVEICDNNFHFSWMKLLLIGLTSGILSGISGVGGAIILVPLLHIYVGIPMNICIGTTLPVVMFNSLSAVMGYIYHGFVRIRIGTITGIVAVFAAICGATISMHMDNTKLRKIFATVILAAGMAILIGR